MGSSGTVRREGMRRGRLRGVPTELPAPSARSGRQLSLLARAEGEHGRREVLPGVVHVGGWLDLAAQRELVRQFRVWAVPPAGLRHPRMPTGHLMSVQSVCLGWHWQPYVYSRTADDTDGAPVKALPESIVALARSAVDAAYGAGTAAAIHFRPDAAIVNLYAPGAKLGLHQDGEEPSDAPVVTLSVGRYVLLPPRRCRSPHCPVYGSEDAVGRPARVRRPESAHLPRRTEGGGRDGTRRSRSAARAPEHHRA